MALKFKDHNKDWNAALEKAAKYLTCRVQFSSNPQEVQLADEYRKAIRAMKRKN